MKILNLEFKNFNSYGNKIQRIDFPTDSSGFFHIQGPIGVGKTTIKNVIEFVLYGKLKDKKLKDVSNRINGGAWAKMEVILKNKNVVVEAGIEPSFIKLTVDGIPYQKANIKGPREYLTEELLDIPFHVFNNIISISIHDFKSFLNMTGEDKKKIIDKIFGFHIINKMRDVIKSHSKTVKERFDASLSVIESAQRSMDSSINELDMLSKKLQEKSEDREKELKEGLEKFRQLLDLHKSKISDFLHKEKEFKNELNSLVNLSYKSKSTIHEIANKLKLYDNNQCPTCTSDLTSDFHQEMKGELINSLNKAKNELKNREESISQLKKREVEIESEKKVFFEKESTIKNRIALLSNELKGIEGGPKDEQVDSIKNIISKMEEQIVLEKDNRNKSEEILNWNRMIDDVLGEKGVKQMAIKTILPSLNAEIYKLMKEVHLDYKITFDEEFEGTIKHLNEDISINSLSRGEKKKVDFVVLIAIIKLMKMKFPSINLLFLDELLDGLDEDALHSVVKILKRNIKDLNVNTFIISHASLSIEPFDYKIIVEKRNGFSNLEVLKL